MALAESVDVAVVDVPWNGVWESMRIATLAEAYRVMEAVGQKPIRVHGEISGFAMNRIQAAMLNEMVALVREGTCQCSRAWPLSKWFFRLAR